MFYYFRYKNSNFAKKCYIIFNDDVYFECVRVNRLYDILFSKTFININVEFFVDVIDFFVIKHIKFKFKIAARDILFK